MGFLTLHNSKQMKDISLEIKEHSRSSQFASTPSLSPPMSLFRCGMFRDIAPKTTSDHAPTGLGEESGSVRRGPFLAERPDAPRYIENKHAHTHAQRHTSQPS